MTEQRSTSQTRFVVDLGNIELPPIVERQIESEIRAVVLKALANPELGMARNLDPSIFNHFPGQTLGLWINPDNPEGSWDGTVPQGLRAPFVTRNMAAFPSMLASTKASGAEAIRLSRVKDDLHLEELDASGQAITGFVLHPITNNGEKKVTAVEITREGSSKASQSLRTEERPALAAIVDELSQIKGSEDSSTLSVASRSWWGDLMAAIDAGIACGLAAAEGGLNPIADVGCVAAFAGMVGDADDKD